MAYPKAATYADISEEVSAYYYQSASGGAVVIGDITNYASINGLVIVRMEQITKWSYVDGTSVELLSASTKPYYLIDGGVYVTAGDHLAYDTYLNLTYILYYGAQYYGEGTSTRISTTCTIYGEIY